jgi:hypothetical protein
MRSEINIEVINKNPATIRLLAIFATRYAQLCATILNKENNK